VAATLEAVDVAVEETLNRRVRYVEKHRATMVKQAHQEVEATRDRYLALVNQVRAVRAELLDVRATETWAALYPSELASTPGGNEAMLALGLLEPVRRTLDVKHQVSAEQALQALEADAGTIAERLTPEQRKELGASPARTPETDAMWHEDPAYKQWAKEQRERLNEMARWAGHLERLREMGNEMRDD
jgi:hypothetical protein